MGRRKRRLPKGQFEAIVESMSHDGKGICRVDGKVHFIFGALPKERIIFEYTKMRSKFAEGRCIKVLEPSTERRDPPCPYFGRCGGCSLQHMSPDAQIRFKQDMLLEQLKLFGKVQPQEVLPPIMGPHLHYRRSARLGARYVAKKGGLLIGFRERYSHFIQEMDSCCVLTLSLSQLIPVLREVLGATTIVMKIPQVETYDVENGIFIIIRHLAPFSKSDLSALKELPSRMEKDIFVFLQPEGPASIHPLQGTDPPTPFFELSDQGLYLEFSPGDFIQINDFINKKIVGCAIDLLEPCEEDVVMDLFCGIGNFTLPMAQRAKHVTGIELCDHMLERAKRNAALNGLDNCSFYAKDLYEQVEELTRIAPLPNKILLDPPRSGAEKVCHLLAHTLRPDRIVYVSCNPATFSRDAGILVQGGYHLKKVRIADMFPHTSHAETIGLFEP